MGFPGASHGKESACNAGDPSLIPGLGRSAGEGKGYPPQYPGLENSRDCIVHGLAESDTTERLSLSWASLVAQMVKHLPTTWETWVRSLGWEDPLEKEMATHSSIHAWKIPLAKEPSELQSMGLQRVRHD